MKRVPMKASDQLDLFQFIKPEIKLKEYTMIKLITLWFKRAVPSPTEKNFDVQVGVHMEECVEMMQSMKGRDSASDTLLGVAEQHLHRLAESLKAGDVSVAIADRKEFLDSLADQIVTATGCGHMSGMMVAEATERVNTSNWSKFDANGQPIFNANGKIAKNPETYKEVNLDGLY